MRATGHFCSIDIVTDISKAIDSIAGKVGPSMTLRFELVPCLLRLLSFMPSVTIMGIWAKPATWGLSLLLPLQPPGQLTTWIYHIRANA